MNKYIGDIFPPVFYLCIALAGSAFTSQGLGPWYDTLAKPSFTPPGSVIGMIWTVIYILAAISLIIFISNARDKHGFWPIIGLYITNGIINALWSYIFFTKHLIGLAVIDAGLIGATVLVMIMAVWRYSAASAILLLPYLGWVSFATYLTYIIHKMN